MEIYFKNGKEKTFADPSGPRALLFYSVLIEEFGYEFFPNIQRRYKNISFESY
jgi:hypothetical protein